MKLKLHRYQKNALSFMLSKESAGLFLDPGLGKTSITLSTIKVLLEAGEVSGVLIVAPIRVIKNTWPEELKKWDAFNGLTYSVLHGPRKKDALFDEKKDIYLINPEGLPWLFKNIREYLRAFHVCPFDALVVDESTKFKNPRKKTTKGKPTRFKYLCELLPLFKRRYILTGTPSPKSYLDIWPQVFVLDEGEALEKSFYRFRELYFSNAYSFSYSLKSGSKEEIEKRISSLVLDMSAKDYLQLPLVVFSDIVIELPKKIQNFYKTLEDELFFELDDTKMVADTAAISSLKCHQLANGRIYEDPPEDISDEDKKIFLKTRKSIYMHSEKVEALKDLVEELGGKPLLVAYSFKHDKEAICEAFGDVPELNSSAPAELQDQWNRGEIPLLLCNPAGVSHGVNLQKGGHHLCWFSLTWNLEHYLQFNARLHRQGVEETVFIYHIVASKTVDHAMLARLGERAKSQIDFREALKKYKEQEKNGMHLLSSE